MNLASELLSSVNSTATAIFAGSVELTYGELLKEVERTARLLLARGGQQDRVALWAENGVFFVISYLAVIRAGMVAVPLQTDCLPQTAIRIVKEAGIRTILVSTRYQNHVSRWASDTEVSMLSQAGIAGCPEADLFSGPLPERDFTDDLAALMFTSGSTGQPKGVMVTHRNIACNTRDIVSYLQLSSSDRALVVLPFHYCFGLSVLHTHLFVGGSVVINNQFMYPEEVLQELERRECTGLAGVPSTYQILLRQSRFKRSCFPSLRWLQQAGGRLPSPCIQEIAEAFPRVNFFAMYGQTEGTARLSYLPPDRVHDKIGSIGTGLASTRLEVLATDGRPVKPGSEEIGEIVASGDNITRGYWNDPSETAKYFRGGKLHTGDLARVDADGFIYIVEREREMIKCGGNRVSAKEVEDAVAQLPHVVEVVVLGAPHEILGEAIVAFVTLSSAADIQPASILDHCRSVLPGSKIPEAVVHLRRLPHGSNGKVLKRLLAPLAAEVLRGGPGHAPCRSPEPELEVLRVERLSQRKATVVMDDTSTNGSTSSTNSPSQGSPDSVQ